MKAFKEFFSFIIEKGQRKGKGGFDSISEPQSHVALTVPPKLCRNLYSFQWLKPKNSLVSNFIPFGSSSVAVT